MIFKDSIKKNSLKTCLIDDSGEKHSYADIYRESKIICKNLEQRSLILVLAENNISFVKCYISFFENKMVQMLINSNIDKKALDNIIQSYKPNYIFINEKKKYENAKKYILLEKIKNYKILKQKKYIKIKTDKNLAILLSTSGSTGTKKFVKLSYENILDNTKNIIKFLKIKSQHKTITTMQPYYSYGFSILNTHLYAGASIVITNLSFLQREIWNVIKFQKVTSFGGVPYIFEILKKIKIDKMNLTSLKYITQAGGALDLQTIKYFLNYGKKKKIKFIIMYGQTEASPRMTYLPFSMLKKKIGSIGIPIPGGSIRLKKNGSLNEQEGEIIYAGKNVFIGYANNFRDLKENKKNLNFLSTGDLAKKDRDGYYYIVGRESRNVKIFGHRVNLDDLEKILKNRGYDCLCHGKDNNIMIFYINNNYDNKILNLIVQTTKLNIVCFRLRKLKQFPFNESGKISYYKLNKFL